MPQAGQHLGTTTLRPFKYRLTIPNDVMHETAIVPKQPVFWAEEQDTGRLAIARFEATITAEDRFELRGKSLVGPEGEILVPDHLIEESDRYTCGMPLVCMASGAMQDRNLCYVGRLAEFMNWTIDRPVPAERRDDG